MRSDFHWYKYDKESVAHELKTDLEQGLSNKEALSRLHSYKRNELPDEPSIPISHTLFRIIISTMLPILLAFSAYLIYSWTEGEEDKMLILGISIISILIVKIIISSFNELRSDKYLYSLRKIAHDAIFAKVMRSGHITFIKVTELVPGDIIYFEAGDQIPADGRLIEAKHLIVDESVITGVSTPVEKNTDIIESAAQSSQLKNMVFMKSIVKTGRGAAIVTATGNGTLAGQQSIKDDTIVQRSKSDLSLSKNMLWFALICIICSAVIGGILIYFKEKTIIEGVTASIILMMSAWPAGLIEAITMTFSVGLKKLSESQIVIKNLPNAEQLADVEQICSNKKGIMTEDRMMVNKIFVDGEIIEIGEDEYESKTLTENKSTDLSFLLSIASLCTNTEVKNSPDGWTIEGDSTEGALMIAAMKGGINKEDLSLSLTRIGELPYDYERQRQSVIYKDNNGDIFVFTRGTVDAILNVCTDIQLHGYVESLDNKKARAIRAINRKFAKEKDHAECVAFAYYQIEGELPHKYNADMIEQDMIFLGMMSLIDHVRPDTKSAVRRCLIGGIKPIMITEDSKESALGLAKELGMARGESDILTGEELETLSERDFYDIHDRFSVFAEVLPSQKAKIVKTLRESGRITAMMGKNSSDADAISQANVKLSAGKTGSSAIVNTSDVLILDGSFNTAVKAVEGIRNTLQNVKKVIRYFLSISISTSAIVLISFIVSVIWDKSAFPPLSLLQVLWINISAVIIPAFGIIFNPITIYSLEDGAYTNGKMFNSELKINILIRSLLTTIFALIVYGFSLGPVDSWAINQERAMTATMTILFMSQIAFAFQCCRTNESGFFRKFFGNKILITLSLIVIIMHISIIYVPYLSGIFETSPLSWMDWIPIIIAFAIFWLPLDELFTTSREYDDEEDIEDESEEKTVVIDESFIPNDNPEKTEDEKPSDQ
ncbi:TPA: cation-transporting P-type ATPase [Candidatus Poribacteria bacterium]|nr:cation-transporting P-type ATPase [Candidatus Poribacteria bacterium]